MTAALTLALVVIVAYLATHVAFEWIARRFLIVSGAEYLLLGILLGPMAGRLITASSVGGFAPFIILAFGWIGASIGAQFFVPHMVRLSGRLYAIAFTEAILTLASVAAFMAMVLAATLGTTLAQAAVPAVALGAIATAANPAGIAIMARVTGTRELLRQLQVTAGIDGFVAIVAFGLLTAISHDGSGTLFRPPTPTEWAVIALAIGFVAGALFHLFLGTEHDPDRLSISLMGALILSSGAAAHLRLSPLLPAMLIGIVLVNTSRNREDIVVLLQKVERPLYFVLLIFAGAAWRVSEEPWILPVFLFLLWRIVAKIGSARLAARVEKALPELGDRWGIGLLGNGGLAVAIALNYRLQGSSYLADLVFTCALASALLTDLFSARFVQSLLGEYARGPQGSHAPIGARRGDGARPGTPPPPLPDRRRTTPLRADAVSTPTPEPPPVEAEAGNDPEGRP